MIKILAIFFLSSFLLFGSENDSLFWFDVNDIEDEIPYFPLTINKVFTGNHLSIIDSMKKIEEKELEVFRIQIFESTVASNCLLYTSPSPRDGLLSRMPSSA